MVTIKYKRKVYPATTPGGLEGLWEYSSTLSLTLVLQKWEVSSRPRPRYRQEREPVPIDWKAGWVPWPIWTGVENLTHTGIRCIDRPARSESL